MKKKNVLFVLIIGLIVISITLLLFFLPERERITVDWLGLAFILIAECIFFIGLAIVRNAPRGSARIVFRSGSYFVLSVYTIAAIIVAVVFMISLRDRNRRFIAIEVVLAAVAVILLLIFLWANKRIEAQNVPVERSAAFLRALASKALLLKENPKYNAYTPRLNEIYEALCYTDISASTEEDMLLADQLAGLRDKLDAAVSPSIIEDSMAEIMTLIRIRNKKIKSSKTGVF